MSDGATTGAARIVDGAMGHAPVLIVDDFLPLETAAAMRADVDAHFGTPYAHRGQTHQVWNYWFVPGLYTYLRTLPQKVIRQDRMDAFFTALTEWSIQNLGLGVVNWPNLSLYVPGCMQHWHNDSTNGRFAFVYSLTRNERATTGGETLVMRDGDIVRGHLRMGAASANFMASVAPAFNRLVLFDDRAAHAVTRIDGSMDTAEGRLVLHGHISEAGPVVTGALPEDAATPVLIRAVSAFTETAGRDLAGWHGPVALKVAIDGAGAAEVTDVLLDRVLHPDPSRADWEPLREALCERIESLRFPAAGGETSVILPVMIGGPLKR